MKFGGTSVGSAAMISEAVSIIKSHLQRQPVVVISAVSKITDMLIDAGRQAEKGQHHIALEAIKEKHNQIMEELGISPSLVEKEYRELEAALSLVAKKGSLKRKELDTILSFGERLSSKIVAERARKQGINAAAYNAYDIGMATDSNFGAAEILPEAHERIRESIAALPKGTVPIITGYIAKNSHGEITTLGRGGSDYSASIIGAAIDAEEVQIWTDVDGVMTADPRIVPDARTIPIVSFGEASELAYLGAKVLHPKTIIPVVNRNIPVRVLNTYSPEKEGTTILMAPREDAPTITSIACKKSISAINIHSPRMFQMHGFLHKIFKTFDEHNVSVDMISTSEVDVSVTVDTRTHGNLPALLGEIGRMAETSIENGKACISVVGRSIKRTPGISSRIFTALAAERINVEMISQGASEINIGLVIREDQADSAIRALHRTFFGG